MRIDLPCVQNVMSRTGFDVAKIKVILKTRNELLGRWSESLFNSFLFSCLLKNKTILGHVSILNMQNTAGYFIGSAYMCTG